MKQYDEKCFSVASFVLAASRTLKKQHGRSVNYLTGRHKVITLCGSTRFKDAFMGAQKRLTLEGNIDISAGLIGHSDNDEV